MLLNAKTINIFFLSLFAALFLTHFFIAIPYYTYFLLAFIWFTITTIGSFNILWNYHIQSFNFYPNCPSKKIALTFDDGPHPIFTPQVLDLLKLHQVKATFFCIGKNITAHPDLFKRIVAEGHTVGNHTYHHSNFFGFYRPTQVVEELQRTNLLTKKLVGKEMTLFRPPFGVTNPSIKKALLITQQTSVGWSVRSLDTVIQQQEKILTRITKKLKAGDIVLLHDTSQRTVETLRDLLTFLEQHGFEAVRVDDFL